MRNFLIITWLCLTVYLTYHIIFVTPKTRRMAMEYAYYEGQKDAIQGDVRVHKDDGGCWHWSKSPWDDDKKWPLYIIECK